MSVRSEAAQRIADWINKHRLNNPFGGEVNQSADKRHYDVLFAYPRYLDGLVSLYSPKFVLVQMQGPWANGGADSAVFESVDNAIAFLHAAFVAHDWDAANAIPRRVK